MNFPAPTYVVEGLKALAYTFALLKEDLPEFFEAGVDGPMIDTDYFSFRPSRFDDNQDHWTATDAFGEFQLAANFGCEDFQASWNHGLDSQVSINREISLQRWQELYFGCLYQITAPTA